MARTRKSIQPLNLYKYDVLIEDQGPRSDYFKISQFDGYFYGGRNAFLVAGAGVLHPGSKILVEILNKNGTTVYSAPITKFVEGNSRMVQVEVYSDTPIGPGKIVLLGNADTYIDGRPIPEEWRDKYNVRWITDVVISPLVYNKTPIRFETSPSVVVEEKFYNVPSSSLFTENVNVPVNIELTPKYYNVFPNGYQIRLTGPGNTRYFSEYAGGTITGSIYIDTNGSAEVASISLPITRIYNSTLAESTGKLIYTDKQTLLLDGFISNSGAYTTTLSPFGSTTVTGSLNLVYNNLQTFSTGSETSFAKLRVVDAKTLSGEINKVRVSYKSSTQPGEYVTLSDVNVGVVELFAVDSGSNIAETGKFRSVNINDYWYSATMSVERGDSTPTLPTYYASASQIPDQTLISQCCVDLLDSISATPAISASTYIDNVSSFIGNRLNNSLTLFPRSEYTLAFDAFVSRTSASIGLDQSDYGMEVFLVPQENSETKLLETNVRGQLLGKLTPQANFQKQNFERVEFNFSPRIIQSGKFGLRFVFYGGFWNIANVSVKTAQEPFFSPDEVDILIPIIDFGNDILEFRTEYLDINNNTAGVSTFSIPLYVTGSQRYVKRSGDTMSGPLYVNGIVSATEFVGLVASASYAPTFPYTGSAMITGSLGVTGSLTITGSGTLINIGPARFTGSLDVTGGITGSLLGTSTTASYVSSSALTNQNVMLGVVSASSMTVQGNLVVLGSSSVQYVTSSQLNIGTNIITVNVQNPSPRFGGLAVVDSGSSPQRSGSLLFDSLNDQWIFVHQNQTSPTSSILLMGPQTYNNIGNETALTNNYLIKSVNAEHVSSSQVYDNGTNVGIGTASPDTNLSILRTSGGQLPNTGTTPTNAALRIKASANNAMYMGVDTGSPYGGWIQVADVTGLSATYPILLNPNGGNVGIGTTSPGALLHVQGAVSASSYTANGNVVWHAGNDGASSGLDADLLDGQHGTYYTTAGNLSGTIPSSVLGNSTVYIGTTAIALNRSSTSQTLTGTSIDGNAGTVTNGVYTNGSYADPSWITSLAGSKISGNISGNAANITAYTINQNVGTSDIPTFAGITSTGTVLTPTLYARGASSNSGVIIVQSNAGSGTAHWITSKTNGVLHIGGSGASEPSLGAIVVNSANNFIGIGTDNPGERLEVSGSIRLTTGANRYLQIGSVSNYYYRLQTTGDDFQIIEGNNVAVRFHIDYPSGNVGLGTTSPGSKLHVSSSVGAIAQFEGGAGRYIYTGTDGIGHYIEQVGTTSGERVLRIQNSNGSGTYTQLILDGANQRIYTNTGVNVGIGTTSPASLLHINGVGQNAGLQINTVKTYVTERLTANATQARRFEIARIGIDYNDWNQVGVFTVELFEYYYSRGLYKRYVVSYGYNNNSYRCDLVENVGSGDNQFQVTLGTPVLVSGDEYYLPVYVDVKYYSQCDARITTNRAITTNTTPGIGATYINLNPTPSNISDFTPDSQVVLAGNAGAYINGNVGIGTASPSNKLDVIGNMLVQGTQGFNATNETATIYIGDSASYIQAVYDGGLDFYQNSVQRVRIQGSTGNVGIGTTSPGQKLDVVGRIRLRSDGSVSAGAWHTDSSGNQDVFVGQVGTTYTDDWGVYLNSAWRFQIRRSDGLIFLNGKTAFETSDSWLRINQSAAFASGVWFGSTPNLALGGTDSYLSLGSNGGTTNSRVYVRAGTYNGTNVINFDGTNGNAYFAGNVGIGTTSPATALTVAGAISGSANIDSRGPNGRVLLSNTVGGAIALNSGSTQVATIQTPSGGGGLYINDVIDQNIRFTSNAGSTTTLFISPTAAIGINNSNPQAKLHIEGGSANWSETTPGTTNGTIHLDPGVATDNFGNAITFGASDTGNGENAHAGIYVRSDGSYGTKMYLATTDAYISGAKTRIMIDFNGNVGMGNTSPAQKLHVTGQIIATDEITAFYSDARLKTITGKIENALDKIQRLSGYYYTSNELAATFGFDTTKQQVGVLAQEVEEILPELVTPAPFDMIRDENDVLISKTGENYKTVKYEKLVPVLIEAIKEQQTLIRQLQDRIDGLYKI